MFIDWDSKKTEILLNPRMPSEDKSCALNLLPKLESHIWLSTSGSNSGNTIKYAALSREALLASAKAVNEHLQSDANDVWINPLPAFHVGGLGIYARSYLSGANVIPYQDKWDPHSYCESVLKNTGTLSSLVPTQVYDLVQAGLQCPQSLRAIVVGGGQLAASLYEQAVDMGWPLLPSYGMTEACSQIATAEIHLQNPDMKILPHVEVATNDEGFIVLKGESLLTTYAIISEQEVRLIDPKINGWLTTEDKGIKNGKYIQVLGRGTNFVKIAGESVDMGRLEIIFNELKMKANIQDDAALIAVPDTRLGHAVHLAVAGHRNSEIEKFVVTYDEKVLPFERIRKVHYVDEIPRSPLQKLLRQKLLEKIKEKNTFGEAFE